MTRTAAIFSPIYFQHNTGRDHPESAKRLGVIVNELKNSKLSKSKNWQFVTPEKASVSDVGLVHDFDYIRFIKAFCSSGGGLLDLEDTMVSSKSFDVALYAAGGTLKAVKLVMERKFENAFALVRPPGHHAEKFRAMGFCVFNNVAIAAKHLIKEYDLKRILILDIDAHHGNGTQKTFYGTNKVLYISLHQDPRLFPGTGFIDELGEGAGLGYTINVPLPFRTNDSIYLKAMREIVTPIVQQYKPQFILMSAGLDGHYADPVGNLSLSTLCYERIYEITMNLASEMCKGMLVSVLEGGYSLSFVGKIATTIIAKMSGANYTLNDKIPTSSKHVRLLGKRTVKKAKRVFRAFWDIV
jgi:acetoin utilization deacetylase AcuC-like enzyme